MGYVLVLHLERRSEDGKDGSNIAGDGCFRMNMNEMLPQHAIISR